MQRPGAEQFYLLRRPMLGRRDLRLQLALLELERLYFQRKLLLPYLHLLRAERHIGLRLGLDGGGARLHGRRLRIGWRRLRLLLLLLGLLLGLRDLLQDRLLRLLDRILERAAA